MVFQAIRNHISLADSDVWWLVECIWFGGSQIGQAWKARSWLILGIGYHRCLVWGWHTLNSFQIWVCILIWIIHQGRRSTYGCAALENKEKVLWSTEAAEHNNCLWLLQANVSFPGIVRMTHYLRKRHSCCKELQTDATLAPCLLQSSF